MKTTIIDGKEYKLVPVDKKKEPKNYALFELTMSGVGSWNGKWSGSKDYYAYVALAFRRGKPLFPNLKEGGGSYQWDDGWCAHVKVTFVTKSEANKAKRASKGFLGYEWMCYELMKYGEIKQR